MDELRERGRWIVEYNAIQWYLKIIHGDLFQCVLDGSTLSVAKSSGTFLNELCMSLPLPVDLAKGG